MKEMLEADMRKQQTGASGWATRFVFFTVAPFHSYVPFDPVSWSALLVILVNWGQLKVVTPFLKIWNKCMGMIFFFSSVKCMWWHMFCVLVLWTFIQFHDRCGVSQVSLGQMKVVTISLKNKQKCIVWPFWQLLNILTHIRKFGQIEKN